MSDWWNASAQLGRLSLSAHTAVGARCGDILHLSRHRGLSWLLAQFLDSRGDGREGKEGLRRLASENANPGGTNWRNLQWVCDSYDNCCFHQWPHLLGLPAQLVTVNCDRTCHGCN